MYKTGRKCTWDEFSCLGIGLLHQEWERGHGDFPVGFVVGVCEKTVLAGRRSGDAYGRNTAGLPFLKGLHAVRFAGESLVLDQPPDIGERIPVRIACYDSGVHAFSMRDCKIVCHYLIVYSEVGLACYYRSMVLDFGSEAFSQSLGTSERPIRKMVNNRVPCRNIPMRLPSPKEDSRADTALPLVFLTAPL